MTQANTKERKPFKAGYIYNIGYSDLTVNYFEEIKCLLNLGKPKEAEGNSL